MAVYINPLEMNVEAVPDYGIHALFMHMANSVNLSYDINLVTEAGSLTNINNNFHNHGIFNITNTDSSFKTLNFPGTHWYDSSTVERLIVVINNGADTVTVKFGTGATTSTVAPGASAIFFGKGNNITKVAS